MPKRSSKRQETDPNRIAFLTVQQFTESNLTAASRSAKNPHAVALGKLGGPKGGKARAAKLSAKKRVEIAKKGARARWAKNP